jgi:hypothetical protein
MRASLATLALLAALGPGCAASRPTSPPDAVVHFRNFAGNVLIVTVETSAAVIRPCGGDAALAAALPPENDPRVDMAAFLDPSGVLDGSIAATPDSQLNAQELRDSYAPNLVIIWSTADYGIADLPRWVTFLADGTEVGAAPPLDTAPPSCSPWPPSD